MAEQGDLESWPWPTPEELAEQELTDQGPAEQEPPRGEAVRQRARTRRSGRFGGGLVAAVALLALLVGTLGGLLLAPWFGIEAAVVSAPSPQEQPSGGVPADPSPDGGATTPTRPDPVDPSPLPTDLPDSPPPQTLPVAPGGATGSDRIDVVEIAARALPSTVALEVRYPDGSGSSGSGFVIRQDGFVLTNAHVVSGAQTEGAVLTVVFADGEQGEGRIVGLTNDYDLAVVAVDRTDIPALPLGDSDAVVVGQDVVAVGAPLGLQGTVTAGIVSALNRPVQAGDAASVSFINAIQTDAAINPGNSGGPLLDAAGAVIGINSAIAQASSQQATGSIGLGFAIPSNQARRTAEELLANGYATYPVIGVLLDSSWTGVGVRVSEQATEDGVPAVTPDGPAATAGIEPGDVIVAIDGRPITAPDELIVAIRAHAPGETVVLTIREDAGDREVAVVLGQERSR